MAESTRKLSKKDIVRSWVSWMNFSHCCYNYERLQAMSFAQCMSIILKKLYPNKDDFTRELSKHTVFFNTEPNIGTIIHGVVIAMEEERAIGGDITPEAINAVKSGLMGPFAGIGDTIVQAIFTPIFLGIGIGMAQQGNFFGPILFVLLNGGIILGCSYGLWMYGYRLGQQAVTKILASGMMNVILCAAGILGCTVMGALTAQFVTVGTPIAFTLAEATAENAALVLSVQKDFFDAILKGLLPLILTFTTYKMISKGLTSVKVLMILVVVGFVGGAVGILG